jgi:ElaB/YqjD/DUF883 family membrane-anchored ribosome-binding protein
MSNADDYQAKLEAIQAITAEEMKSPNMPVDDFVAEADYLAKWAAEDESALTAVGLDWALVTDLPVRAGALREAQSLWMNARFAREDAEKEWAERSPEAYDLRDVLLHNFRFAYRNHKELKSRVDAIAEGSGNADMLQDLNDLSVLGKANPEPLNAINFDMNTLDTAAALSAELSEVLSQATVERGDAHEERIMRDKAHTYLKQAVDQIRETGQYVFWRNPQRAKGYVSQYFKRKRKKSNNEENE